MTGPLTGRLGSGTLGERAGIGQRPRREQANHQLFVSHLDRSLLSAREGARCSARAMRAAARKARHQSMHIGDIKISAMRRERDNAPAYAPRSRSLVASV